MRVMALSVMCAALLLPGARATAGIIHGTVWLGPKPATDAAPDPKRQRGVHEAVVYVERIPEGAERDLTTRRVLFLRRPLRDRVPTVVQRQQFEPRVLATPAGSRVAFLNLDRVYHNAFSVAPARRFDLGKRAPGARDTVAFTDAGVINLHCDIHPDELGFIVVTPNHAFTRPDALGRYRLPKLPPGRYTVHVFLPRRRELVSTVELPRRGDLTLDLSE
jgi:hypothetical protein